MISCARRREARRQHQRAAVGQVAVIGAVLVHDRQALDAPVRRAALGDVDDARVEIAVLAGDALVDRVGDDVRDAPPVLRRRGVAQAGQLLLGEHVPQAELDLEPAVGLRLDGAGDQRLRVDQRASRRSAAARASPRSLSMKACGIERLEQAGALEIGATPPG